MVLVLRASGICRVLRFDPCKRIRILQLNPCANMRDQSIQGLELQVNPIEALKHPWYLAYGG